MDAKSRKEFIEKEKKEIERDRELGLEGGRATRRKEGGGGTYGEERE